MNTPSGQGEGCESARSEALDAVLNAISGMSADTDTLLQVLCDEMRSRVPGYDWVGFYIVDPGSSSELVLGPYSGAPTEHIRIPFGEGICGQAAQRLELFLVEDVSQEENYLSCSPEVRSEIVVPVICDGHLVGELDIDSHSPEAFTELDRKALSRIADLVSKQVREHSRQLG